MRRIPIAGLVATLVVALGIVLLRFELSNYHLGLAARVGI
jgi:hypothetical protein